MSDKPDPRDPQSATEPEGPSPTTHEAPDTGSLTPDDGLGETSSPSADELVAELAAAKDQLLRTLADMENLRRRTEREVDDAKRYAVTTFARDLLEVADSLNRAIRTVPAEVRGDGGWADNFVTGVEMTERALLTVFEKHKMQRVSPTKGEKFDHQRHQAMFEVPTAELAPGQIAEVMADGYVIADRLLRPAMVGVAKAPQATTRPDAVDETA
ncbi:MAG: nucleotide exchange factor GrpE [Pseudomonadota bacterium]